MPAGSVVTPSQTVRKGWRVVNCGSTAWEAHRAARVDGLFGPDAFSVPSTAPGATADLFVEVQAPRNPGCYHVEYALQGPQGAYGAGLALDVQVGPAPPPTSTLTLEALASLLPVDEDLGDNWSRFTEEPEHAASNERGPAMLGLFRNTTDYPHDAAQGRIAGFFLQAMGNVPRADDTIVRQRAAGYEILPPELALGDGVTARRVTPTGDGTVSVAAYLFRVQTLVMGVTVLERDADPDDLEGQLYPYALKQLERVRTALATATPPGEKPCAPPPAPAPSVVVL